LDQDGPGKPQHPSHSVRTRVLLLLLLSIPACSPARGHRVHPADSTNSPFELRLGSPIVTSYSSAAPMRFRFTAPQDSIFRLDIFQRDMRLLVAVLRPDGEVLLEQTTPLTAATSLVAAISQPGSYSVTIAPQQPDGRARQVTVALADLGPPNPRRALELTAAADLKTGDAVAAQWTQEALDNAAAQYGEAASAWRRAADMPQVASALLRQGSIHFIRGQYGEALASYREALKAASGPNLVERRVDILNAMAAAALTVSDEHEAEKDAQSALALSSTIADDGGRGRAFVALADLESFRSNPQAARSNLDQANAIWATTPDRAGEARSFSVSAYLASESSAYAEDFEDLTQSLRLSRSIDDHHAEASTLNDMGNYYMHVDELEHARDSYNAAVKLSTQMGCLIIQAAALDDFGYYLESVGDPTAPRLYERAETLIQKAGYSMGNAVILSDLSRAYIAEGKLPLAIQYGEQELRIATGLHLEVMVSQALRDTGEAYMAAGKTDQALKLFTQAIDPKFVGPRTTGHADTAIELGRALERLGRTKDALAAYQDSAAVSHELGTPRSEAEARYRIATILAAQGQLDAALTQVEQAVPLIEALRTRVSPDDTRTLWFASFHSIYTLDIDLLMQLSAQRADLALAQRAFQRAELSRARSFVELLHEARVDKGNNQALASEAASVRRLLADATEREGKLLASKRDRLAVNNLSTQIADLHERSEQIEAQLRAEDPEYFKLQVGSLDVAQAQALIGGDDVVLEYSMGSPRSYLWAISKSGVTSFALPDETEIEPLVRKFRRAAVAPNPELQRYLDSDGVAETAADEERLAASLGHVLLAPVPNLSRFKRIVVVADGTLQYLPFSVLIAEDSSTPSAEAKRIADDHQVINLPSMTALSVLRNRRNLDHSQASGLVVFADPVFEADDPRIAAAAHTHALRISPSLHSESSGPPARSASLHATRGGSRRSADRGLPRLPGTRHEADLIQAAAPAENTRILLGFDANREQATSPEMGAYRFIHFATHSVFDDEHPESSGVILSMFKRDGAPDDGTLRLRNIYDLKLSADLVVLSACDTALGKSIKGEGIVGLTRGFMYAGSPRVVATLWRVDDDATREFMKDFYEAIFTSQASPAAALRQAQAEMRQQPRFHSPYYWGAFILEGEWLPLDRSDREAPVGDTAHP
jgi:CHAT domain-containing protein